MTTPELRGADQVYTRAEETSVVGAGTVRYEAPESVSEVMTLLQRYGDRAKLLAGGQSLMVFLRKGLLEPKVIISLKRVPELRGCPFTPSNGMQIGAMVTQTELELSNDLRKHYQALSDAAAVVASVQVRNRGTLAGNLCHADPTADPPAALIALGATLEIASSEGNRTVLIDEFFQDYMEVNLGPEEVVTRILLPPPVPHAGSAYLKHRVRHVDTAIAGTAVWVQLDDQRARIRDARIGLSGVGTTPLRAEKAEAVLRDAPVSDERFDQCCDLAATNCDPLDDTEGSEWYRREVVRTLVRRALTLSVARARMSIEDAQ